MASETGEDLWDVEILSGALTGIRNLPAKLRALAWDAITDLAFDPYSENAQQLRGFGDYWKIRIDSHRIIYRVSAQKQKVLIDRVGPRETVYSGLGR